MTWIRRTRLAATYGGGGIVGVSAGMVGLLAAQAKLARRGIGTLEDVPHAVDGVWWPDGTMTPFPLPLPLGEPTAGIASSGIASSGVDSEALVPEAIVLAVLGDSLSVGLGVARPHETPGGLVASAIAAATDRPVIVRSGAFVGAQSADLDGQIDLIGDDRFDVAMMMVGANDVTHRVLPADSVAHLSAALERLAARGIPTVLGTCPDLGTVRPIPHPLRFLCRQWSRSLASRQADTVVSWGGLAVSLGDHLGPEFAANPHEMFGADRFHPSTAGYATAAAALTPAVLDRLGILRLTQEPTAAGV